MYISPEKQLFTMKLTLLTVHYLRVGDADNTLYEAILFCGLENRHSELSILLYPLGVISSRPVLVAQFLWGTIVAKQQYGQPVKLSSSNLSIFHQV